MGFGFLDIFRKVIESPIVKTLAGVVAHAVPVIGPVIEAAVPTLDAIFSNANPPESDNPGHLVEQATVMNFPKDDQDRQKIFDALAEVTKTINSVGAVLKERVDKSTEALFAKLEHNIYLDHQARLNSALKYFEIRKANMKDLTAAAGSGKFNLLFDATAGDETLPSMRKDLAHTVDVVALHLVDSTGQPSHEFLQLYLAATHWLLLFDKHHCVSRTPSQIPVYLWRIRSLAEGYLSNLQRINGHTKEARQHANDIVQTLKSLKSGLHKSLETTIIGEPKEGASTTLVLKDKRQPGCIGYISHQDLETVLKVNDLEIDCKAGKSEEPGSEATSKSKMTEIFDNDPRVLLYRTLAMQRLESELQVVDGVIDAMAINVRNWNDRLPVQPAPSPKLEHVVPKAVPHIDDISNSTELVGRSGTSKFWGKEVWYAVTYVNSYGEGSESDWVKVDVNREQQVQLKLGPVTYANDPTVDYKPVKSKGKEVHSARGISRRIYAKCIEDGTGKESIYLVGTAPGDAMEHVHNLMDNIGTPMPKV